MDNMNNMNDISDMGIRDDEDTNIRANSDNGNIVFIGSKPLVNYIKSVIMQFNKRNVQEVVVKSRGKFISKAVDVAEVSKRVLEKKGVKVKNIAISSDSFEKEGKRTNVSTMDIILGI